MKPSVCVITCTGQRPELLGLCSKWLSNQSYSGQIEWLVATDTDDETPPCSIEVLVDEVPDVYQPRNPSRKQNWCLMQAMLSMPTGYHAVIMEDDDWYSPSHVEECVASLEKHDWSYQSETIHYNIPAGKHWVTAQGVEANVAVHMDFVGQFALALEGMDGWRRGGFKLLAREITSHVGIKGVGYGLPGRPGLSSWHRGSSQKVQKTSSDPHWEYLRQKLGPDAEEYLSLLI